ncbi:MULTISPECIES: chromate efflux transporter [Rhodobacterales]|jgi:chromate transporter|uniref:Chromate transport protein ChrA1 n=4 Tax=Rhodobacterales TaxID=204455 RepID=A0A5P3AN10_9RHOB|nr:MULTISPECIES: chromate efflux transporter [Rhodobacterales]QEW24224.1 chromate transport protein ChrA1 [Marinibacterium anthonyi]AJE49536.1 chromate transporter [Celeribacter indicus]MDK3020944.1 chromate efflux transporter [Pseudodonghicola flavimaris]QEW30166.1 chromate transport protein ChrA1 [Roseovarius indicus]SDX61613.1 chromate transporter [Celeribacter indicus]
MSSMNDVQTDLAPSLSDATRVWWKIGILSFGGPAAQIALMHKEVVEDRSWLSEQQFLNALSLCMLLPGPEAMQLATYAGWRLHGTIGGLIAGLLFVVPGAAVIMALAAIYSIYGNVPLVEALFYGIKAAVLVIVVEALLRVAKKALSQKVHWVIAALAFVGIFFLSIPYPLIVLMAGLFGWFMGTADMDRQTVDMAHVSVGKTGLTIATWMAIWLLPLLALGWLGAPDLLVEVGRFFSTLAVVTFGGAYAVLAYMAQDVVVQFGWLTAGEMVDALGLAETTPGPLILVTQFVGFLAGFKEGGLLLGLSAAVVALWVTFAPCFLWIFAGAPYIEWISNQPRLKGALKAITAAVVGVILNLSLWFALHVLFTNVSRETLGPVTLWRPDLATIEWLAVALFLLSCFLAFRLHWGIIRILLVAALLGAALRLFL